MACSWSFPACSVSIIVRHTRSENPRVSLQQYQNDPEFSRHAENLPCLATPLGLFDDIFKLRVVGGFDGWYEDSRVGEARFGAKKEGDEKVFKERHREGVLRGIVEKWRRLERVRNDAEIDSCWRG